MCVRTDQKLPKQVTKKLSLNIATNNTLRCKASSEQIKPLHTPFSYILFPIESCRCSIVYQPPALVLSGHLPLILGPEVQVCWLLPLTLVPSA